MPYYIYMKPLWGGGMAVCSNGPGHMIKMPAMIRYGKTPSKISETEWQMTLKLGM